MRQVGGKQAEHKLYYIFLAWSASGGAAMMDTVLPHVNAGVDFSFKGQSIEMCS